MPFDIVENADGCSPSKPWGVLNRDTGERLGCHPTKEAAKRQQAALYANEPGARAVDDQVHFKTYAVVDVKEPSSGEFEAVLSTPDVDRDVEVVLPGAFNPLPGRLKIHVDHTMSTKGLAGSGTPFYDGDTLKFKGRFASTAVGQEVRQLVLEGHLDSMSVGFLRPEKTVKDGVTHITRAELIEASFVTVPSNVHALVTAAKSVDVKVGARNSRSDAERLKTIRQHLAAIHDTLAELGVPDDDTGKSVDTTTTATTQVSVTDDTHPDMAAAADIKSPAAPSPAVPSMALQEAAAFAAAAQVQLLTMRNPS